MYRIHFLSGRLRGRAVWVDEPIITIGSGPNCAVRITESGVADCHLQCQHEGRSLVLVRLGPAPVTVNGRVVEIGEAVAVRRARVELGSVQLRFETSWRRSLPRTARSVSALEVLAGVGLALILGAEILLLHHAATESRAVRDAVERARAAAARSTNEPDTTESGLLLKEFGASLSSTNVPVPARSSVVELVPP